MKKSVVAAVAASNLTIFSGLVDASVFGSSGSGACGSGTTRSTKKCCEIVKDGITNNIYECKNAGTQTVVGWCAIKSGGHGVAYSTSTRPSQCPAPPAS